jgi:hypothetical protein
VSDILKGTGTPAQQYIPKPDTGYSSANDTLTYDPAKAKQLLTEAGYPNGFTMSVVYPASGSGNMVPIPMDQYLQSELAKVGVTVKLEQIEWSTMVTDYAADKVSNGADAEMISLGFYPPDQWMTTVGTTLERSPLRQRDAEDLRHHRPDSAGPAVPADERRPHGRGPVVTRGERPQPPCPIAQGAWLPPAQGGLGGPAQHLGRLMRS